MWSRRSPRRAPLIAMGIVLCISVSGCKEATTSDIGAIVVEPSVLTSQLQDGVDLNATSFSCFATTWGVIVTVVAVDGRDETQIRAIRARLTAVAQGFARGVSDQALPVPASAAPDLGDLPTSVSKLKVLYGGVPKGAKLTFASTDHRVVAALHSAFALPKHYEQ